eukprot:evm.model.scf_694.3 EVM.evm.TU.scf_694.3   scf_694:35036-35443(-)
MAPKSGWFGVSTGSGCCRRPALVLAKTDSLAPTFKLRPCECARRPEAELEVVLGPMESVVLNPRIRGRRTFHVYIFASNVFRYEQIRPHAAVYCHLDTAVWRCVPFPILSFCVGLAKQGGVRNLAVCPMHVGTGM